ncbi:unnamed protein product [Cochlearia groenlandica]
MPEQEVHRALSGLSDHLIKAQSLLTELERLVDEAALAIETPSTHLDKEPSDETRQITNNEVRCHNRKGFLELLTCCHRSVMLFGFQEKVAAAPFLEEPEVAEYAAVIAVVDSMVKQNYAMQEKIVRSLSIKTSCSEIETYTVMWSLRPFVQDEIINIALKCIY